MTRKVVLLFLALGAGMAPGVAYGQEGKSSLALGGGIAGERVVILAANALWFMNSRFGMQFEIERRSEGIAARCFRNCMESSASLNAGPRIMGSRGTAHFSLGPTFGLSRNSGDIGLMAGVDAGLRMHLTSLWSGQIDAGIRTYLDAPQGRVVVSVARDY